MGYNKTYIFFLPKEVKKKFTRKVTDQILKILIIGLTKFQETIL